MSDNIVCCTGYKIYGVTDKAIRLGPCWLDDDTRLTRKQIEAQKVWIPSSLIEFQTVYLEGEVGDFEMPKWVADKNDLKYE